MRDEGLASVVPAGAGSRERRAMSVRSDTVCMVALPGVTSGTVQEAIGMSRYEDAIRVFTGQFVSYGSRGA